jgi:hypothetical protein
MVTLTYPFSFPGNGKICKEHLRRFLQELRREHNRVFGADRSGEHSSFWFLEFQQRGAPHFHIFTTWAPSIRWCAQRWYDIVGSDDIRHFHAGTRVEFLRQGRKGTISYASKYAAKLEQKVCPPNFENVGRWWGVFGRRATVSASTFVSNTKEDQQKAAYAVRCFWKHIKQLIFKGLCEVLIREPGVVVLNVIEKYDQVKIRAQISRIACTVQTFDCMFMDAELDLGDG